MDKLRTMSEKEIKRTEMMSQLAERQITQRLAGERLGISVRQVKRLWNKYQKQGVEGLINKSRG